jgi:hypothetical protein
MRINNEHFRRTAQMGRAGGMIWMILITLLFEFYNLYFAQLSIFFTISISFIIITVSSILFYWTLNTLKHARAMPLEKFCCHTQPKFYRAEFNNDRRYFK